MRTFNNYSYLPIIVSIARSKEGTVFCKVNTPSRRGVSLACLANGTVSVRQFDAGVGHSGTFDIP